MALPELDAYLKDPVHGCTVVRTVGAYRFTLTYRPLAVVAYQDLRQAVAAGAPPDSVLARYAGLVHFTLNAQLDSTDVVNALIARHGPGPDFAGNISQGLQEHGRLVTCGDSVPPALVYYPRLYEMAQASDMLLAFPAPEDSVCDRWEVVLQGAFPGSPPIGFAFDRAAFVHVPGLDYISPHP